MSSTTKDELRRHRLREYDAVLAAARASVSVLVLFARGREARGGGGLLEEAFAAAPIEGVDPGARFPAGVWVTLRQGDIDATLDAMMQLSEKDFVVGEHEEVDAGYRLTTVEERRPVPDVDLLQLQVAAFLHIPRDVVAVSVSWGADDPRTAAEVESLLEQRFGAPVPGVSVPRRPLPNRRPHRWPRRQIANPTCARMPPPSSTSPTSSTGKTGSTGLTLSSAEFIALLHLTPEQGAILTTLVRQTVITIAADGVAPPQTSSPALAAEVGAFGRVLGGVDRGVVGVLRLSASTEPAQQVGAGGVPRVVLGERQPVDQREGDLRAVQLGDGDRAVEGDDRRRVEPGQLVVQRDHLRPVRVGRGRRVGVHGVDRGEDLVATGSVDREALADQVVALGDQGAVPAGAVLLVERDQLPVAHPGLAPRLDEHHQREQAGHLRLVGQQLAQDPGQPDGLGGQLGADRVAVAAGEVALVEDEEQHGQHAAEPLGQVGRLGHPVRARSPPRSSSSPG